MEAAARLSEFDPYHTARTAAVKRRLLSPLSLALIEGHLWWRLLLGSETKGARARLVTLRRNMPLSPAERAKRYRQELRKLSVPRKGYQIRVTGSQIKTLVKLGYLSLARGV